MHCGITENKALSEITTKWEVSMIACILDMTQSKATVWEL